MKNWAVKIIFISLLFATIYAGASIEYFNAYNEGDGKVRLEWKSGEENLNYYAVERRTPQTSFVELQRINPQGNNSLYNYIDEAAYKATDVLFTYRLKIVDGNNISYSKEIGIPSGTSNVTKSTWGSIKAMFR